MMKLNLLPLQYKKGLELIEIKKLTICLIVWILIFWVVFSLFLASCFLYLSALTHSQEQLIADKQNDLKMIQLLEIKNKIINNNAKMLQVYEKQNESLYWTPIILELIKLIPNNVYLTDFHYQKDSNVINLSGRAGARDEFLLFQNLLEQNSLFIDIKSPLSNLLHQKNIDFSISFKPVKL